MRSLIFHANKFATKVVEASTKPAGIIPESTIDSQVDEMDNCLVIFFCVEKLDSKKQIEELYAEILKSAKEVNTKNLMISPFGHLSSNLAEPNESKNLYEFLKSKFEGSEYKVGSSPFGYHKSLLLNVKGHPGAVRFREFVNA